MAPEQLAEYYLGKAKEAEAIAKRITDPENNRRWLAIAEGYRVLARGRYDSVPR